LKKRIKHLISVNRIPLGPSVEESVRAGFIDAAVEDITNGKVLKVKEVAARLRCSEDTALKKSKKKSEPEQFKLAPSSELQNPHFCES